MSGLFATVLTYPLDFVKVRYIAQDGQKSRALDGVTRFRGTLHAIRASYSVAGLAPMYQGIGAAMCASSASWAIYFGVFRYLQMAYRECFSGGMGGNAKGSSAGPLGDSLSASSAGVVATLTTCPLWLVKTRMQLQRGAGEGVLRYRSTCHGLKHILKNEGVVGLYSGYVVFLEMDCRTAWLGCPPPWYSRSLYQRYTVHERALYFTSAFFLERDFKKDQIDRNGSAFHIFIA